RPGPSTHALAASNLVSDTRRLMSFSYLSTTIRGLIQIPGVPRVLVSITASIITYCPAYEEISTVKLCAVYGGPPNGTRSTCLPLMRTTPSPGDRYGPVT